MSLPIPSDIRLKILSDLARGDSKTAIAHRYGITRMTVYRISKAARTVVDSPENIACEIERLQETADILQTSLSLAKTASEKAKIATAIADLSAKIGNLSRNLDLLGSSTGNAFKPMEPFPLMPLGDSILNDIATTSRDNHDGTWSALVRETRNRQIAAQIRNQTANPLLSPDA